MGDIERWTIMVNRWSNAPLDTAQEVERLTERYDAVRHAYGVEAQERGRLEQQLRGAVEDRERLLHGICDALESGTPTEPILRALLRGTDHEHHHGGQSQTPVATDEERHDG